MKEETEPCTSRSIAGGGNASSSGSEPAIRGRAPNYRPAYRVEARLRSSLPVLFALNEKKHFFNSLTISKSLNEKRFKGTGKGRFKSGKIWIVAFCIIGSSLAVYAFQLLGSGEALFIPYQDVALAPVDVRHVDVPAGRPSESENTVFSQDALDKVEEPDVMSDRVLASVTSGENGLQESSTEGPIEVPSKGCKEQVEAMQLCSVKK